MWSGNKFKRQLPIKDDYNIKKEIILQCYDILIDYNQFHYSNPTKEEYYFLLRIMSTLMIIVKNSNKSILLEKVKDDELKARALIWDNEEISNIFKTIQCPNYQPKMISFSLKQFKHKFFDCIFFNIEKMRIIARNQENKLIVYLVVCNKYSMEEGDIVVNEARERVNKILASCPIIDWAWKPTKLFESRPDEKTLIKIKRLPFIQNIKEINIECQNFENDLDNLLVIVKKYNDISFNIDFHTNDEEDTNFNAKIFAKQLILVLR